MFGYVFDSSNQYSVGSAANSAKLSPTTTDCSTAGVGVIIEKSGSPSTIEFCLDGTNEKSIVVDGDNAGDYLIVGTALGSGSVLPATRLSSGEGQDNAVVTIGSNYIIFNEAYTSNGEIYCANDKNKIETRRDNICSSTECDYYICNEGRCTESDSNCPAPANNDCNPVTNQSKCTNGGFYIVDHTGALITTQNSDDAQSVTLYKCTGSAVTCTTDGITIPTGYITNADDVTTSEYKYNFIKCDGQDCEGYNAPNKSACSEAGELINLNSSTLTICLQMTNTDGNDAIVSASLSESGAYLVDTKVANVFGNRSTGANGYTFVIVDVTSDSVQLHGKVDSDKRFKYTDSTYKVYVRSGDRTSKNNICNASQTINEFELNQCSNYENADNYYYKLNDSYQWPSN
jgi:hypothetical protein